VEGRERRKILMIVRCALCKRIVWDRPPYNVKWDRGIVDGICDQCIKPWLTRRKEQGNVDKQKKVN